MFRRSATLQCNIQRLFSAMNTSPFQINGSDENDFNIFTLALYNIKDVTLSIIAVLIAFKLNESIEYISIRNFFNNFSNKLDENEIYTSTWHWAYNISTQRKTNGSELSVGQWVKIIVLNRVSLPTHRNILAVSCLRTCRPPPSPQKWWILYERCGVCWKE